MSSLPDLRVDLHAELGQTAQGDLDLAERRFAAALGAVTSAAVAFSGGVDSSVTAALAARHLHPENVTVVLGVSPSLAVVEREQAARTASAIGVRLVEVETHEMDAPGYVANDGNRCYFCKHELYTRAFAEALEASASDVFVNGDTADDHARGDRPGRRAGTELGIRSPLAAAGIDKLQVRALARALRLPVWDKPSAPCLASRVALNTPVTVSGLARIERAEASLRALGLRELRVRHLGANARVELSPDDLEVVRRDGLDARVLASVAGAGYMSVEISPSPLHRD